MPMNLNTIYWGDCLEILKTFPDNSVHACISSPPYLNLRSYLPEDHPDKLKEIGYQVAPEEYVDSLVEIYNEVKRVLHSSGLNFLNIGDSYATNGTYIKKYVEMHPDNLNLHTGNHTRYPGKVKGSRGGRYNLKANDLIGVPWAVAFALRDSGWWLRDEIIWAKGISGQGNIRQNLADILVKYLPEDQLTEVIDRVYPEVYHGSVMPESHGSRPVKAHEHIMMYAKSKKNYIDMESVREEGVYKAGTKAARGGKQRLEAKGVNARPTDYAVYSGTRHMRDVWAIPVKPSSIPHYAMWNEELVAPMIKMGTSEHGVCAKCGAPYERIIEKTYLEERDDSTRNQHTTDDRLGKTPVPEKGWQNTRRTTGWKKTCACNTSEIKPAVVLDPFCGVGITCKVAKYLGRDYIGIDLCEEYVKIAQEMIAQ